MVVASRQTVVPGKRGQLRTPVKCAILNMWKCHIGSYSAWSLCAQVFDLEVFDIHGRQALEIRSLRGDGKDVDRAQTSPIKELKDKFLKQS